MTLEELEIGEKATVRKLKSSEAVRRRIMDMGITKGVQVSIVKIAPLGDPIQLLVRGYDLALRREDAKLIEVM